MGKILWECTRLFTRRAKDPIGSFNVAKLSHPEVSSFLSSHEYNYTVQEPSAVKGYVTNQLAANDPLEDTRAEAKCLHKNCMMFGVYDGHGGASCARVLAKRLFSYIAVPLLPQDQRKKFIYENDETYKLIEPINDLFDWRENRVEVYHRSLKQWANSLEFTNPSMDWPETLKRAFDRLDSDIGKAAEEEKNKGLSLGVAMSGAVACVAVVAGIDLHVAYAGDCQAVLGQSTTLGSWNAKKLTNEHTCDNEVEVARIKNEHPPSERLTLIQDGRLFQSLVPLRAFGDYRYKWSVEQLEKIAVPKFGRGVIPPNYATPPYLTATPDVVTHRLTEKDKFLVIGSDGLWDVLSPQMVVQLVGDHMTGKSSILQLQLHKFKDLFPGRDGKEAHELRPVDKSAATHLIRAALGGDHEVVSKQLSFPMEHVRIIRDDMTVTVIYFNTDFINSNANGVKASSEEGKPRRVMQITEDVKPEVKNPEVVPKPTLSPSKPVVNDKPATAKLPRESLKKRPVPGYRGKWDGIEHDEKVLNFDLDRAVEQGGFTTQTKTIKRTNLAKVIHKSKKVPFAITDLEEQNKIKKMQILSLRNESLKKDSLIPKSNEFSDIKDEQNRKD
ncbi:pyruvate dehydrogenase [acetyl-transferring]-phosphatase 1, mitochondrial-like isoform X2 [Cimex lectularius]|uniref:PPM-type phosphatase domain-containing protein n=1 Tax=Cimex lectularius TaxID=79782 RepID=A0A8I6RZN2_CIMLE|nr:pyruvate dehydrogenase [acetyl-transferring]-phosphatase 1, mitochondrial-like isoform X2 [Cimex lectularius]